MIMLNFSLLMIFIIVGGMIGIKISFLENINHYLKAAIVGLIMGLTFMVAIMIAIGRI